MSITRALTTSVCHHPPYQGSRLEHGWPMRGTAIACLARTHGQGRRQASPQGYSEHCLGRQAPPGLLRCQGSSPLKELAKAPNGQSLRAMRQPWLRIQITRTREPPPTGIVALNLSYQRHVVPFLVRNGKSKKKKKEDILFVVVFKGRQSKSYWTGSWGHSGIGF